MKGLSTRSKLPEGELSQTFGQYRSHLRHGITDGLCLPFTSGKLVKSHAAKPPAPALLKVWDQVVGNPL